MTSAAYKVLIVEDDPSLLEMYEMKLKTAGFDTYVASDGESGFLMAKNILPNIILLDILMPKVDGYGVLKQLKKLPETKDIPVIIFSNLSQKSEVEKGIKLGAADFIIKTSVTPAELISKLNNYLTNNKN